MRPHNVWRSAEFKDEAIRRKGGLPAQRGTFRYGAGLVYRRRATRALFAGAKQPADDVRSRPEQFRSVLRGGRYVVGQPADRGFLALGSQLYGHSTVGRGVLQLGRRGREELF